ncbi:MAG: DNA polymerase III subunit gamma/tau [Candidatus Coatesbacteria bacterium]|nr:DNA polymerase III subunit gamma/tau [Candidatus Coatesbacteria bacterium]
MAEYVVIARKYRPATFEQLVGQEHIARTLQNAIKQNKIAHALLFCGPRGVGKTTTARIFAKSLNCMEGPTPTPCCKCSACREIPEGSCIDVIEIDGASNNSVDDIRLLRENARYAPSRDRYKVYIIDEVHMLTPQAFNALLKTLEEPPSHVKFVFATTAPERIPATILSRCQRYNFRRVGHAEMLKNLREIAEAEGIQADEGALGFIAQKSGGSMRDAQSILDQARSMTTERLTLKDVSKLLSVTDTAFLAEFVDALVDAEPARVIDGAAKLFDQGVNFRSFFTELIGYFHNMLLVLSVSEKDQMKVLDLSSDEALRLIEQAKRAGKNKLFTYLNKLLSIESEMARSAVPRISFEVAALGLCHIEDVVSIESLLSKLTELQKGMAGGRPAGILEPESKPIETRRIDIPQKTSPVHPTPPEKMAPAPRPPERKVADRPSVPESSPSADQKAVQTEEKTVPIKPAQDSPKAESSPLVPLQPSSPPVGSEKAEPQNRALFNASNIPIVKRTLQMFDGVVEDVKTRK